MSASYSDFDDYWPFWFFPGAAVVLFLLCHQIVWSYRKQRQRQRAFHEAIRDREHERHAAGF